MNRFVSSHAGINAARREAARLNGKYPESRFEVAHGGFLRQNPAPRTRPFVVFAVPRTGAHSHDPQ